MNFGEIKRNYILIALGAEGRRFESCYPDSKVNNTIIPEKQVKINRIFDTLWHF